MRAVFLVALGRPLALNEAPARPQRKAAVKRLRRLGGRLQRRASAKAEGTVPSRQPNERCADKGLLNTLAARAFLLIICSLAGALWRDDLIGEPWSRPLALLSFGSPEFSSSVVGVLVGFLSTYLVRLRIRRPWRDAATGSIALFALNLLGNSVDIGVTFSDGHALGWRGLILNHQAAWAIATVVLAVTGRQLWASHSFGSRSHRPQRAERRPLRRPHLTGSI